MSRWLAQIVMLILLAGPGQAHDASHDQRLPTIGAAADFTLTSQRGYLSHSANFAAKWSPLRSSSPPVPIFARC